MVPAQGSRTDVAELCRQAADPTVPISELIFKFPGEFLKFYKGVGTVRNLVIGQRSSKSFVYWLHGPTGTGKSRFANAIAPFAYWKPGSTKWWDGYEAHDDVIIDDYRRDLCTFSELLRLFDRYPYIIEGKGVSKQLVAKRIFVTTPKDPEDTWEGRTQEDLAQLTRRIDKVIYFENLNKFFCTKGELTPQEEELLNNLNLT